MEFNTGDIVSRRIKVFTDRVGDSKRKICISSTSLSRKYEAEQRSWCMAAKWECMPRTVISDC